MTTNHAIFVMILVAFGSACATQTSNAPSFYGVGADEHGIPPRPAGATYPNWQHMCLTLSPADASDLLTEAGNQGWELVAIGDNGACFKRPATDSTSEASTPETHVETGTAASNM